MSVSNKQTFVAVVPVNQTTTLGREEVLARSVCEPPKLNLREVPLLLGLQAFDKLAVHKLHSSTYHGGGLGKALI